MLFALYRYIRTYRKGLIAFGKVHEFQRKHSNDAMPSPENQILGLSEHSYVPKQTQEGVGPMFVVAPAFTLGLC